MKYWAGKGRRRAGSKHLAACLASGLLLLACSQPPAGPPLPVESATVAVIPTSTSPPPPRPTAAPPALSPPSKTTASPEALPAPTPRPPLQVRSGQLGTLSDSGLLIAAARGFFTEQGLDHQAVPFSSPSQALSALSSGLVDAASLPISAELFNLLARGAGLRIVAEAAGAPPGHGAAGVVVRPDLLPRLRTPTDLRGFRIGLPARGDSLEVELGALLKQGWLARTDVEMLVLPVSQIVSALADGSLDAAMLPEPDLSEVEQRGLGQVWRRSDRIVPNHLTAALLLTLRFSRTQPEAARRYVTAYLRALRLYNDAFVKGDPAERGELLPLLGTSTAVPEPARLERIVLPGMNPNGMVNVQTLLLDQSYFLATGQQQREVDLAGVVDTQYAAYAITRLGEYR